MRNKGRENEIERYIKQFSIPFQGSKVPMKGD